jgi:hypothetical protein
VKQIATPQLWPAAESQPAGGLAQDVVLTPRVSQRYSTGASSRFAGCGFGTAFYAQLKIENAITGIKNTKWVPLVDQASNPVETAAQTTAELKHRRNQRARHG